MTLEELAKMFEEETGESSEELEEGLTLEELLIEEGIDPAAAETIEEKSLSDTADTAVISDEETGDTSAFESEKVEVEGVSILSDGVMIPIDEWLAAQEITEEGAALKPLDFVEAAALPIEATGKAVEPAAVIEASSPEVMEDTYQPEVTVVSSTAEKEELDILAEYEKFLSEYGGYTEAESDMVEESTMNNLFTAPAASASLDSAPETTMKTSDAVSGETEPASLLTEEEEGWIEVPVEGTETDSTEQDEEKNENFLVRFWNRIKEFFIDLWASIKDLFSLLDAPEEEQKNINAEA